MTESGDSNVPDVLRSEFQTRHPGIAEEIEGAIHTLRKLQELAGTPRSADPNADPSLIATADGTLGPPGHVAPKIDPTFALETSGGEEGVREAPALEAGASFGRYQVVRLLGKGAMGAVYLAYDSQLQRHVALKTPSLGDNPQTVERFFREARSAAQLRSPFVCPVYDVGQIGGIHYLSMAFIDGQPMGRAMAEGRFKNSRAVATVVAKIARGVQKAHEAGIMHRDLKPDNIMIDADGEPIVMDFGLARRVDDDIHLTAAGKLLGTPAYMSPEQVEGDPKNIGPATDQYSLGVILYHMLTGQLPFRGSLTSVLRQIGSVEPPRPSTLCPDLAAGSSLERICVKMMAKSAANRYPSLANVVQALEETFLAPADAPAARPSVWKRLRSWLTGSSGGQNKKETNTDSEVTIGSEPGS